MNVPSLKSHSRSAKTTFGILVFDGVEEQDVIGPFEALKVAAEFGAPFKTVLLAERAPRRIKAAYGLEFWAKHRLPPKDLDVLLVPGGGWLSRARNGTWAEAQRGRLPKVITKAHQNGTTIAAICAGIMLLPALFKNRPAITHHAVVPELKRHGVRVVRKRVVDDGDLLSAGGVTAGIDMGLHLIERFSGKPMALRVARYLEYPWTLIKNRAVVG